MIELPFYAGYTVAVLGLGKSGLAAARALTASGAEVWAWDDNEDRRAEAAAKDVPLVDLYTCNWLEPVSLVLSPGIPHTHPEPHPVAALAREQGIEIIGDIELLGRAQPDARYLGITGTNGKSTTTAIAAHVLELSGRRSEAGGNLGEPVMTFEPLGSEGIYVLELSSYQLELTFSITFDVAVLLNISPDHLDRHGGMEGYVAAKRNIFRRQSEPRTAVVGIDDEISLKIFQELKAKGDQIVWPISAKTRAEGGVYVIEGVLFDDTEGQAVPALDLKNVENLTGQHNWQNAAAAYAACKAAQVPPPVIAACLRSFPGLAHRQERVGEIDGVLYVNDSKATNAEATARALACHDSIYWIAGGRAKEGGLAGLEPYFPKIAKAFLIGEAEADFAAFLDGKLDYQRCGDLATALAAASAEAHRREGATVLLSPACASFDQFPNFEARGDAFRSAVRALSGETAREVLQ
jgi:UDP-N-acetylmuramoylalanine--D-glutamate ligase